MQATQTDVFAFRKSGLDAFLHSAVGAEANGSTLTILSVLARLGKDPWAEAERWSALPKAAVIDSLAQSIAQMPLAPSAIAEARDNAARLVHLLPRSTQRLRQASAAQSQTPTLKWVLLAVLYFAFAGGMMLAATPISRSSSASRGDIDQSSTTQIATDGTTKSLPKRAAVAGSPVSSNSQ
jgi:hypothetical protein